MAARATAKLPTSSPWASASDTSAGVNAAEAPVQPTLRGVFGGSAWRIARVAGIDIAIDQSWVLIFGLITLSLAQQFGAEHAEWTVTHRWVVAALSSVVFFASIVFHELGHSLTAQRLGLRVRSITLFLFGGVAQLTSEPKRPRDEILIASAGPLVSAALGVAFLGLAPVVAPLDPSASASTALQWLGSINLVLAVFNLIPGFPLDGGRIFRGIVWALTGSFMRATRAAAGMGTIFAMTLMGFGALAALVGGQVLGGLWLVFIGWFLLTAARASVGGMLFERFLTEVAAVDTIVDVSHACVAADDSVAETMQDAVLRRGLRTLYVIDAEARLLGLVTLGELAAVPEPQRATTPLSTIMTPRERLDVISPQDSGWTALNSMVGRGLNQVPVVRNERLLGAVTRERLMNVVRAALLVDGTALGDADR